jgi:hypothetical protein
MFGKNYVGQLIERSAENPQDRRRFLRAASAAGLGVVGASAVAALTGPAAMADEEEAAKPPSDAAILNFALNLEYLEAEFYSNAVHGHGLAEHLTHGSGRRGRVKGGARVPFTSKRVHQIAYEIAKDELDHVKFLRGALGSAAVSRPNINIKESFTAAAHAAGLIKSGQTFDVYANEDNFLLGAFIFEDVGVTAYKGAAPLISNKTYLSAAAELLDRGLGAASDAISKARDSLDGPGNDDQGVIRHGRANIVPTDSNGLVYGRSTGHVLNIVYLTPKKATSGGFFPHGVNGSINTSSS